MASSAVLTARSVGLLAKEGLRVGVDRVVPDFGAHPRSASGLSPAVLEDVMGLPAGSIRSVAVASADSGTAGRARLRIEAEPDLGIPSRIFVKLPPQNLQQHLLMNLMDLGSQEVAFYRQVAPEAPIRVPRCYGTHLDQRRGRNLIILEDLDEGVVFRDVRDACTATEAEAVIDAFADLHAAFWASPRIAPGGDLDGYGQRSPAATRLGHVVLKKILTDLGPSAEIVPVGMQQQSLILLRTADVAAMWGAVPQTITHGDTHLGNLFFEGATPGFLDWQVSTVGPGIRDVAYFIAASLEPDLARSIERQLIERYSARLAANGVDFEVETAWTYYRAAVTEFYVSAVAALEMGGRTQPPEIARSGVERVTAAAVALGSFDVLESLLA